MPALRWGTLFVLGVASRDLLHAGGPGLPTGYVPGGLPPPFLLKALLVRTCRHTLLATFSDLETLSTENRDQRDRFHWLLAGCAKVIPDALLKERIEIESLGDAGIVRNSRTTGTKFVKIKTRLFYKQNKYNLFREESEGYAKLATELSQEITSKISPDYMIEVMRSLIGCFNLDPNRVLDIVLEAFECRIHLEDFFVPLLTKYLCNPATISQVLGFKFTFYQGEAGEPTPLSLYRLAAVLIRNEVIALDDLYSLLLPDDAALAKQHKKEENAALQYAKRSAMVIMSSEKKTKKEG
uniref:Putative secreted protein n=1 Tax=Rhipicephalus microplus TaxID=6941 RepID=A0A6G5ACT8_RHIMP